MPIHHPLLIDDHQELALTHLAAGYPQLALDTLDKVTPADAEACFPIHAETHQLRGVALRNLGRVDEAQPPSAQPPTST